MKSFPLFRMRTLILSGLCGLIFVASAFSQPEVRGPIIAVIPFAQSGRVNYGGAELADLLSKELAGSSKFDVVDKAKTSAIEPELLKGPKDAIEASAAAEIGRTTGAQFLVLGQQSHAGCRWQIDQGCGRGFGEEAGR